MNARRAVAALDDVLWVIGLEHVTKAVRSPFSRAGFDQMVSSLVAALQQATEPQRQAALAAAIQQLDQRWSGVTEGDRARLVATAMSQYVAGSSGLVAGTADVFGTHMRAIAGRTRAAANRTHQLRLPLEDPFALIDPRVLEHARTSNALFVRNARGAIAERLSGVARGVVADGLSRGWDDDTIADELGVALRGSEAKQSRGYLTMVSSVFVARSRHYATLRSFEQAGIATYEHVAVLDERTCSACRFMHGRTFRVRVALDQFTAVSAGGPESVVELQPFMRAARLPSGGQVIAVPSGGQVVPVADIQDSGVGRVDALGSFRARVSDASIQRMGCGCPVHPRCRCTIVPGATTTSVAVPAGPGAAPAQVSAAPATEPPKRRRRGAPAQISPPPPSTPAAPTFTVGVHALSFESDIPKAAQKELLDGLAARVPWVLPFLERTPISTLAVKKTLKSRHSNGSYWIHRHRIDVRWNRSAGTWGQALEPSTWSVSQTGATRAEAVLRTLVHELGHHVHLSGAKARTELFLTVDRIIRGAFVGSRPRLTQYAATSPSEHFAEAFAAYVFAPDELKRVDGAAFDLVELVLAQHGIFP